MLNNIIFFCSNKFYITLLCNLSICVRLAWTCIAWCSQKMSNLEWHQSWNHDQQWKHKKQVKILQKCTSRTTYVWVIWPMTKHKVSDRREGGGKMINESTVVVCRMCLTYKDVWCCWAPPSGTLDQTRRDAVSPARRQRASYRVRMRCAKRGATRRGDRVAPRLV